MNMEKSKSLGIKMELNSYYKSCAVPPVPRLTSDDVSDVGLTIFARELGLMSRLRIGTFSQTPGDPQSHLYCSCYSFVCGGDEKLN